jgi:hypothetical protein
MNLFIIQFLKHYFTNKATFSYVTVALRQRNGKKLIITFCTEAMDVTRGLIMKLHKKGKKKILTFFGC